MSVGRPYFDAMVVPDRHGAAVPARRRPRAAVGTRDSASEMQRALLPPLITGAIVARGHRIRARRAQSVDARSRSLFGGYAAHVTMREMWLPLRQRMKRGDSLGDALVEGAAAPRTPPFRLVHRARRRGHRARRHRRQQHDAQPAGMHSSPRARPRDAAGYDAHLHRHRGARRAASAVDHRALQRHARTASR